MTREDARYLMVGQLGFPIVVSNGDRVSRKAKLLHRVVRAFLFGSKAHVAPIELESAFLPYRSAVPPRLAMHFMPPEPSPR